MVFSIANWVIGIHGTGIVPDIFGYSLNFSKKTTVCRQLLSCRYRPQQNINGFVSWLSTLGMSFVYSSGVCRKKFHYPRGASNQFWPMNWFSALRISQILKFPFRIDDLKKIKLRKLGINLRLRICREEVSRRCTFLRLNSFKRVQPLCQSLSQPMTLGQKLLLL